MSKMVIKTTLISMGNIVKNEIEGILKDSKLIYEENNSEMSILIGDHSVVMIAKDDEHILELTFKNEESTSGVYTLLSANSQINIGIYTKLLQISKNYIKIIYIFNEEERTYEIEYGVML